MTDFSKIDFNKMPIRHDFLYVKDVVKRFPDASENEIWKICNITQELTGCTIMSATGDFNTGKFIPYKNRLK